MAEEDKQESLRVAASEKAIMTEKLSKAKKEGEELKAELDVTKREAAAKAESDRVNTVYSFACFFGYMLFCVFTPFAVSV